MLACGQPKTFMGSLSLFLCLENLETDLTLLLGNLLETHLEIADVLPDSIKHIKLHVENSGDCLVDWKILQDFAWLVKYNDFPGLAKVTLIGVVFMGEDAKVVQAGLMADYEDGGVLLSFGFSA